VSAVEPSPGSDVPTTVPSTTEDTQSLPAPVPGALSGDLGCAS
jgi:hypothetical protein